MSKPFTHMIIFILAILFSNFLLDRMNLLAAIGIFLIVSFIILLLERSFFPRKISKHKQFKS